MTLVLKIKLILKNDFILLSLATSQVCQVIISHLEKAILSTVPTHFIQIKSTAVLGVGLTLFKGGMVPFYLANCLFTWQIVFQMYTPTQKRRMDI